MNENEQQLARMYARARDAEQAHMEALRAAGRYREALGQCQEDAEWHLRGESGLPFDASAYACLRAIAETAHDALTPSMEAAGTGRANPRKEAFAVHSCHAGCPCHTEETTCPTCKDGTSGKTRKRDCPTCGGSGRKSA